MQSGNNPRWVLLIPAGLIIGGLFLVGWAILNA